MDILFWILSGYVLLIIHVWFHELGHYTVGRLLVNIPKTNIQIRLFQYPSHVALKDEEGNWVKPNDRERNFISTYLAYDKNGKRAFVFVMGGFILQSLIFLGIAFFIYYFLNNIALANFIVGGSFIFNIFYILWDLIIFLWKRIPAGDTSSAFQFAPIKSVVFIIFLLLSYGALYLYIGFY